VSALVDWVPEVALAPDHAPEAMQEVALVEDQVSAEDCPLAIAVGLAASDMVGPGGIWDVATVVVTSVLPLQAIAASATTTPAINHWVR
jgi:hypothetical protein